MQESRTCEFKERVSNSFLKTVSAFANYGTGTLYFGITDAGEAVGVEDPVQTRLAIEHAINDALSPRPHYTIEVQESSHVIILKVYEGFDKPYLYRSKAYIRHDTSTVEVDRFELAQLYLDGQNTSYDASEAHTDLLSFELLSSKLHDKLHIETVNNDVLKTLDLMTPQGRFTVAAELLADTNRFPGIDMVRYGETIDVLLDRKTYERVSLLEQYEHAVELYKQYYQYEVVRGMERTTHELIPETAFREALVNALIHRDWRLSAYTQIAMYSDCIQITSIGGLPHGITEEEYLRGHLSLLRNPVLGNIFLRLGLVERLGTGILRIKASYQQSLRQPIFELAHTSICVTLPVITDTSMLTDDEQKVFEVVHGYKRSSSEISQATKFGKNKVLALLQELVQQGIVKVTGSGRATRYYA